MGVFQSVQVNALLPFRKISGEGYTYFLELHKLFWVFRMLFKIEKGIYFIFLMSLYMVLFLHV